VPGADHGARYAADLRGGTHLPIERPALTVACADSLFQELVPADDVRLTFAGVGDPLLAPQVFDIIAAARRAGIAAIHVETDLLPPQPEAIDRLVESGVDVVSVHVPAVTPQTYELLMGINALMRVLENMRRFVERRQILRGGGVPILVPTFVKCRQNLGEMEAWYDQWLKAVGSAVIVAPSDCAGQISDPGVADMSPPRRRACARLSHRMTILCDGRVVSCEQDVLGQQVLGEIGKAPLAEIWQRRFAALRADHQNGNWSRHPLCAACKEWNRP
jgi:radical SAM protein with 4Fe4S-binding SPASM domain